MVIEGHGQSSKSLIPSTLLPENLLERDDDFIQGWEVPIMHGRTAIMLHGYGSHRIPSGLPLCHRLNSFQQLISLCSGNGGEDD